MATQDDCLAAVLQAVERFNEHDAGNRREKVPARSVGCTILDLDVTYSGRLEGGYIVGVAQSRTHKADIRVICNSDDLVAMVNRELGFAHLYSTGRVRIDASIRDLIRLRALA